jgi:hypothetical protein
VSDNGRSARFLDSPGSATRRRAGLDWAGFTFAAQTWRLGPPAASHLAAGELAPPVRGKRGGRPTRHAAAVFVLGLPVPVAAAGDALAPAGIDELAAGGLVRIAGDDVDGCVSLRPPAGGEVARCQRPCATLAA